MASRSRDPRPASAGRRALTWLGGLAGVAVAIALFSVVAGESAPPRAGRAGARAADGPVRPSRPPRPGDPKPARLLEPTMPELSPEWRAELAEQVRGRPRPGDAAFRAVSDRYVDENLELARRQAATEGITLPEVRELTYFGLLVLATQRVPDIEDLIGRPLAEADRNALADLMQTSNAAFTSAMREHVARAASEAERWELIRSTQASFRTSLFRITGLDDELLDDLLAGNLALPGAPARNDPPPGPPAPGPRDDVALPPRPGAP